MFNPKIFNFVPTTEQQSTSQTQAITPSSVTPSSVTPMQTTITPLVSVPIIEGIPALGYASTNNILISDDMLDAKIKDGDTVDDRKEKAKQILSKTNLKRACCLNKNKDPNFTVKVRLPAVNLTAAEESSLLGTDVIARELFNKYNYKDVAVSIPISACNSLTTTNNEKWEYASSKCDEFYDLYCANNLHEFKAIYGEKYNEDKWFKFKPECACFSTPVNDIQTQLKSSQSPQCIYKPCKNNASGIYTDAVSRKSECDLTICSQVITANMAGNEGPTSVGAIDARINCGVPEPTPTTPPASTPSASTPSASTPSASTPPASTSPASTPPARTLPASTPPALTPSALTPPARTLPASTPPASTPSARPPPTEAQPAVTQISMGNVGSIGSLICCCLIGLFIYLLFRK